VIYCHICLMKMKKLSGTLAVVSAAVLWSTGGVLIKYVPLEGVAIAGMRSLFAFLVFLPFLKPGRIKFSWKLALLLASYTLMNVTFVVSTKWTTAANAIAIQYTAPLWIFTAQAVFRVIKPTPRRTAPMALAAIGIVFFLMEPNVGSSFAGNMVALMSGVSYALTLVSFRALRDEHNANLVCLANLSSVVILLPLAASDLGALSGLPTPGWAALAYLGAVQIGASYFLYSKGVETVTALRASTIGLLEPVLNPIWVFIIIHEIPTPYGIAGAVAILTGVLLDSILNRHVI